MSKAKIILAGTLSVLAVASVTTAAVVVTQKRKQDDSPKKGNEGNQVVVAANSKFEYDLNAEQTNELTGKLLLVKGQDVTVTLTENNASKTIKTKVKEDGTVDFSSLKDGKTYKVTKIVVKEGEKERDLIAEVKEPKEKPGNDAQPGGTTKPTDPTNGDGKKPGDAAKPTEPIQSDNPSVSGSSAGGATGKETPGQAGNAESGKEPEAGNVSTPNQDKKDSETSKPSQDQKGSETDKDPKVGGTDAGAAGSQGSGTEGSAQAGKTETGKGPESGGAEADNAHAGNSETGKAPEAGKSDAGGAQADNAQAGKSEAAGTEAETTDTQDDGLKNKWSVVESKWDKENGVFTWKIKTSIENYSQIKDKQFKFGLRVKGTNIEDEDNSFKPNGDKQKPGIFKEITRDNKNITLEVSSLPYYRKDGKNGTPEGEWVLFKVYEPDKQSINLLKESAQPITYKYEK
ncbi:Uncharacterised protein [Mycoplasmopsis bovigenitalium]|uniref:Uncharacterized protein n=1 Tax=Mycoplasmopsis bovigenitalium TaxID=2112 RepID=A0A449A9D9_9BACT|nr:hypothetical protein [Mycoplasmopsis bovigenitalium]VEU60868.1 Uncharacterised protein [Mycoplasmopsis bovigenitalium]